MRVRSAAFWVYGERLLALGDAPHPAQAHADLRAHLEAEGAGRATVSEWERLLRHHRAITGAGTRRIDAARLIEVFAWFRGAQLGAPLRFATADPPDRLSVRLRDAGMPHVFGAITAANHWAFYEPAPSVQLYVPPPLVGEARRLLNDPGERVRGEVFADAPDRLVVLGRDLRDIEQSCADQRRGPAYRDQDIAVASSAPFPVTSRFLSLLDCRVHPEGASHAAFLRTQLQDRGGA